MFGCVSRAAARTSRRKRSTTAGLAGRPVDDLHRNGAACNVGLVDAAHAARPTRRTKDSVRGWKAPRGTASVISGPSPPGVAEPSTSKGVTASAAAKGVGVCAGNHSRTTSG